MPLDYLRSEDPVAGTGWIKAEIRLTGPYVLIAASLINVDVNYAEVGVIELARGPSDPTARYPLKSGLTSKNVYLNWNGEIPITESTYLIGAITHAESNKHRLKCIIRS